jgi:prepilin-type N-terminal cleavage/methylation domain-containing protein/prepilin-type processing-associated H-X9-DG protein
MNRNRGFTLVELLIVLAILAVLVSLVVAISPSIRLRAQATRSLDNLHQIGAGAQLYANDNEMSLPGRIESRDKWPKLLEEYLTTPKVYADPLDPSNYLARKRDPLANGANNTSYIMNGYNDVGAYQDETVSVRVNALDDASQTILLALQQGHANFYMDFVEGNQKDALRKNIYAGGSNYLFADGSAHFITEKDYNDNLWLVHKSAQIPK